MSDNSIYAILEKHLVSGRVGPGEQIGIRADQFLTQDGTGTMVLMHLDKLGQARLKGRQAICYVDHNTLGMGSENADDHRYIQAACRKFKIAFSKPGNGIGHQIHLERYGIPGQLLLGADSHVPTLGGLGMLAIGTGGLQLAVALTAAPHYLRCPTVTRVELTGKLMPWCSAKDAVLTLIGRLAERDNSGVALEYDGPGVASLSVPARATMANMGAELGVTSSLFPTDLATRAWLTAQGRSKDYRQVKALKNAIYEDTVKLDLSQVVPMVALPHSPHKVVPVREARGVGVDQVAVGSCTNGSFEDLAKVALILRGNRVRPEVDMLVAPATRQALRALMDKNHLEDLLAAGCRVAEAACGFCIGHGMAPATKSVSVRTTSRNYRGRCGTLDAQVYLVSPETAAATALTGELTDPRDLGRKPVLVRAPKKFNLDDSLVIDPGRPAKKDLELPRGPNIVPPPDYAALPASLNCEVMLKLGDDISTDDILPAGNLLKYRSNVDMYAKYTFAGIAPDFAAHARANLNREIASIIVAGKGYGQGSSREHAAMCPRAIGVRVVIAKSFERIHLTNLVNHGIVPLTFLDQRTYDQIEQQDYLELPWVARELRKSKTISLRNPDRAVEIKVSHPLTRRQINIVLAGGLHNYTMADRKS